MAYSLVVYFILYWRLEAMSNISKGKERIDARINFLVTRIHHNFNIHGLKYLDYYEKCFSEILTLMKVRGDIHAFHK